MRSPSRARAKSFLDSARRDWQFAAFAWLLRNCGGYPRFLETLLVLPTEQHFPAGGAGGHAGVAALFRRVREHAGMADWPCIVEPLPDSTPSPRTTHDDRIRVIRYHPARCQPMTLVSHFAHELARYLVESFEEPPPGGPSLQDPAIDIAAVFMGFGVFMANSSVETADWDLNEGELGHALAIFCLLRKVEPATIEEHLNPHARKYLRLAALDLEQQDHHFQGLRSVFAVTPRDLSEQTLPTHAR